MNVSTLPGIEDLTLNIHQEIRVRASLEKTFAALIEQLGPSNEHPDGTPMPLTLEAWPGGRWFRDLGDNNGRFLGARPGDQASGAVGTCRAPVHVVTPSRPTCSTG